MSDKKAAADRLRGLLRAHPMLRKFGVRDVVVFPRPDGLAFNVLAADDSLQHVQLTVPNWFPLFTTNEAALVDNVARAIQTRLPERYWDQKGSLDLQYLFLKIMDDLREVSHSDDLYHHLRVAALLRILLFDARPLIHRVNAVHRVPISFWIGRRVIDRVAEQPESNPPGRLRLTKDGRSFFPAGEEFDPLRWPSGQATELEWREFLQVYVLKVEDHYVSLQDFVKSMAYVEGLVHFGGPKESERPADHALWRWRRMTTPSGRMMLSQTLAAVGRVVWRSQADLIYLCGEQLRGGITLFDEEE